MTASSETDAGLASNVINGISRSEGTEKNYWESGDLKDGGESIQLDLKRPETIHQLRLTFDTNLSGEIMPSLTRIVRDRQVKGLPHELVRNYKVTLYRDGRKVWNCGVCDNGQRLNVLEVPGVEADRLEITVTATYGLERARIYEVRIY